MKNYPQKISIVYWGTFLEYFDYALFGAFIVFINQHFFGGSSNQYAIQAFWIYGLTPFGKLLGALIFSHLGDLKGRAYVMRAAALCMGGGTLLIGLTPSVEQIGLLAPTLLMIARFIQGLSAGIEFDAAATYLFESTSQKGPVMRLTLLNVTTTLAMLSASILNDLLKWRGLHSYWQWVFTLIGIASLLVFWFRMRILNETKGLSPSVNIKKFNVNLKQLFSPVFIMATLLIMSSSGMYHLKYVFTRTLSTLKVPFGLSYVTMALIISTCTHFLTAHFVDKGYKKAVPYSGMALTLLTIALFFIETITDINAYFMLAFATPLFTTLGYWLILKSFGTSTRLKGASIAHAIASLLSHQMPLFASIVVSSTGAESSGLLLLSANILMATITYTYFLRRLNP